MEIKEIKKSIQSKFDKVTIVTSKSCLTVLDKGSLRPLFTAQMLYNGHFYITFYIKPCSFSKMVCDMFNELGTTFYVKEQ